MTTIEHRSRNSMFWQGPDPEVAACKKHPGWQSFHRECGKHGLYFDDIDRIGKTRRFQAVTFTLRRHGRDYSMIHVAKAEAVGAMAAVLAAFDASIAAGHRVPAQLRDLLSDNRPPKEIVDIDNLLGVDNQLETGEEIDIDSLLG